MPLKQQLTDDMKAAMKSGDKHSLGVIRLINAAIKQKEVDERIEMDDAAVIAVLDKMVKQRKDSVTQFEAAAREDLAQIEREEIVVIERYLPAKMGEAEIAAAIQAAITETGASSPADIGKLMGALKPKLAGQADMGWSRPWSRRVWQAEVCLRIALCLIARAIQIAAQARAISVPHRAHHIARHPAPAFTRPSIRPC